LAWAVSRIGGTIQGSGNCVNQSPSGDLEKIMKRLLLIAIATVAAILTVATSASARLGMAPLAVQDDGVIQVRGRGHGHMHRGGRGHHYGWGRGRGHHYGWRHHRRHY
jgi:hypothetical protein